MRAYGAFGGWSGVSKNSLIATLIFVPSMALIVALHAIGFLFQPSFHPPYAPEIANTIQRWEISTLRDQIHAGRVKRVAIYQDCSSVEVLGARARLREQLDRRAPSR